MPHLHATMNIDMNGGVVHSTWPKIIAVRISQPINSFLLIRLTGMMPFFWQLGIILGHLMLIMVQ